VVLLCYGASDKVGIFHYDHDGTTLDAGAPPPNCAAGYPWQPTKAPYNTFVAALAIAAAEAVNPIGCPVISDLTAAHVGF